MDLAVARRGTFHIGSQNIPVLIFKDHKPVLLHAAFKYDCTVHQMGRAFT